MKSISPIPVCIATVCVAISLTGCPQTPQTNDVPSVDVASFDVPNPDVPSGPVDVVTPCPAGQDRCGGSCVNRQNDNSNCGTCGTVCAAGTVCTMGSCEASCRMGLTNCSGTCRDTQNDPQSCGMCGNRCGDSNGNAFCRAGMCGISCNAGFGDCDGNAMNGCEATLDSAQNCGGCGRACAVANATPVCMAGACNVGSCQMGFADCNSAAVDGCEVNVNNDRANCGACGRACGAGQVCSMGVCAASCRAGLTDCGGSCRDLQNDPTACGACATACPASANATPVCSAGACTSVCGAGFGDCDANRANGCEASLNTNNNCRGCGIACAAQNGVGTCGGGSCAIQSCNAGFLDCNMNPGDGCEIPALTDVNNCGACGNRCVSANAASTCSNAMCGLGACNAGFGNCDMNAANGCEVNLATSAANCGMCGRACVLANAVAGCAASACTVASCNAGFGNCDMNAANGCEANFNADNANCGACGMACGAGRICTGGACVALTTTTPVVIPNSTGCTLLLDTNADQIDLSPNGSSFVVMRCGAELRWSMGSPDQRTFSAATAIPGVTITNDDAAQILARTDRELFVLLGLRVPQRARILRSTDQGATWSAPVEISATLFSGSGPGPSVNLVAQGNTLFATWSNFGNQSPVFTSTDNGATWQSIGPVTLVGTNYCPDLLFTPMGELVLANEESRQVFRYAPAMMSWSLLGTMSNGTSFTDFAAGGGFIYATGSIGSVQRSPLPAVGANISTSSSGLSADINRSMDADSAGNLALVVKNGVNLQLVSWRAGAMSADAPITLVLPGPGPSIPATVAHPSVRAAITAIYNTGFVGGHIAVQTQVF